MISEIFRKFLIEKNINKLGKYFIAHAILNIVLEAKLFNKGSRDGSMRIT